MPEKSKVKTWSPSQSSTKRIDKKWYSNIDTCSTKTQAEKVAESIRKKGKGHSVRIIPVKFKKIKQTGYQIWERQ